MEAKGPATGMKVMSSDGTSLGKIVRVEPDAFVVEKGFFFPKDYIVPMSLLREIREDGCWLSASKDELQRGGGEPRAERDTAGTGAASPERIGAASAGMEPHGAARATGATGAEGEQRLTLSEEELEARKRVKEAGEVVVKKEVVTEHRQLDVPVTREEVHVERTPASSSAPAGEAFREQEIRVPVREEEVEVTKRPRVREEVRVSKTPHQEERRVEGEVRREEARIERDDEGTGPRGDEPTSGGTRGHE